MVISSVNGEGISPRKGTGVGLVNIRERLKALFGGGARLLIDVGNLGSERYRPFGLGVFRLRAEAAASPGARLAVTSASASTAAGNDAGT